MGIGLAEDGTGKKEVKVKVEPNNQKDTSAAAAAAAAASGSNNEQDSKSLVIMEYRRFMHDTKAEKLGCFVFSPATFYIKEHLM